MKRQTFRLSLRTLSLLMIVVSTYLMSYYFHERLYYQAIWPTVLFLLGSALDLVISDILTKNKYPKLTEKKLKAIEKYGSGVETAIHTKLEELKKNLRGCNRDEVSATVHLVVQFYTPLEDIAEDGLVQLVGYAGRRGGKALRITPSCKGIIGRCLRSERSESVNFSTLADYEERMVREFGFSKVETQEKTTEARSYYATPIRISNQIIGVLYLFSTEPYAFPKSNTGYAIERAATDVGLLLEAAEF